MNAISEPDEVYQRYLLAAQAAEEGRLDDAESGLRRVVAEAPQLPTARFQLGQLLWVRGVDAESAAVLAPLAAGSSALAAYARAIAAAAMGDVPLAALELHAGLAMPQDNPALAGDMHRLLERFLEMARQAPAEAVPVRLSAYGSAD